METHAGLADSLPMRGSHPALALRTRREERIGLTGSAAHLPHESSSDAAAHRPPLAAHVLPPAPTVLLRNLHR
jgi:hypothetical protein